MAMWQTSFRCVMIKGMRLNCQTPFFFRRLFHSYKNQICMRNGGMFNCHHRNQKLHPLAACTIHRQSYPVCREDREKTLNLIRRNKNVKTLEYKPYAKITHAVKFWCKSLWPEMYMGRLSKELEVRKRMTKEEVEDSAVRNIRNLSYNQVMDTIAFCIRFHGFICHRLLDAFLKYVGNNFQNGSTVWDSRSISQLMFCVFVFGYTSNDIFRQVEKVLERDVKQYSLYEAQMVLCAYNRCGKKLTSSAVIQQLWSRFHGLSEMVCIDSHHKISSHYLRQMNQYTSHLDTHEQLEAIGNYGCFQDEIENVISVIMCLSAVRFHHANFVHHVTEKIESFTRMGFNIRGKSLSVLCEFVANYGLEKSETYTCCFDNMLTLYSESSEEAPMTRTNYPVLKVTAGGSSKSYRSDNLTTDYHLRFVVGMVIAGKFPLALISHHLSENKIKTVPYIYQLQLLQTCIDIECPNYTGNQLPQIMQEDITTGKLSHTNAFPAKNQLSNLAWTSVNNLVGENFFHNHYLLPYTNKVMEIRLDEENRPTTFDPVIYSKLPSTFKHTNTGIIILVHNKRQTTVNGGTPLGILKLQIRHLKKLGYKVIHVPILDKEALQRDNAEQIMTDMLRKKLEQDYNVVLGEGRTPL